jgi:hypothetical protein
MADSNEDDGTLKTMREMHAVFRDDEKRAFTDGVTVRLDKLSVKPDGSLDPTGLRNACRVLDPKNQLPRCCKNPDLWWQHVLFQVVADKSDKKRIDFEVISGDPWHPRPTYLAFFCRACHSVIDCEDKKKMKVWPADHWAFYRVPEIKFHGLTRIVVPAPKSK